MTVGASTKFIGVRFGCALLFVDLGFGFGIEALGVESIGSDVSVATTGFAPATGGVEGEVMGVEFFEGFAGDRGDPGG